MTKHASIKTGDPQTVTALSELALLFLKLGAISFGGPAVHIAMMEEEVVRRRKWLSHEEFLDLLGATNLIPGPNSTEMAIHVGYKRRGWAGLLVAGASFILPAAAIVLLFAWAYVRYGSLPQTAQALYGVKPVIIAIVLQALWHLGRVAIKTKVLAVVGVAALVLNLLRVNELLVLFLSGIVVVILRQIIQQHSRGKSLRALVSPAAFVTLAQTAIPTATTIAPTVGVWPLFLFFLKVGSVLFGSGYVLLAFLRADLVERWQWLTESQLLDAIAVGQITPGPVFTTATFIGYVLGGFTGAVVATVGIFLPAFAFVAISGPLIPRLRRSAVAGAFLDGLNVASLALMVVVTVQLSQAALIDPLTVALAVISGAVVLWGRINSTWLVLAGASIGCAVSFL